MDTEQQVRLNFLEEVEDYFDRIEGFVLTLAQAELETEKLDAALRAAHSVKGGAAMMSFPKLSQVAHYLEDFFKILRVRGADVELNAEVESLFLRGVDALRLVTRLNRQGQLVDDTLMQTEVQPTFAQLRSRLGELRPEDEERLLAQEENVDVATIVFSGGVEDCLDYFEQQLNELQVDELQVDELQAERLATEITTTAEQLSDFGRMSELDTFVQLCDSVQAYVPQVAPESLHAFAQEALATWRRCHALVLIGRTQNLPHDLTIAADWFAAQADPDSVATTPSALDLEGLMLEELNLAELTAAAEPADPEPTTGFAGLDAQFAELSTTDLASLQEFVGTFGDPEPEPA
ncbi:MAG: Hpt domain-containing protein, partial [Cyanobacteria bacterium P01_H01_bin.121]